MRTAIIFAALVFGGPVMAQQPLAHSAVPVEGVVIDVEGQVVLWLRYKGVVGQYRFELLDTPQPPNDPPDPPDDPPETDLTAFVEELTAEVEAVDHDDVAKVFLGIADRIASNELNGYTAIGKATANELLGPMDAMGERPKRAAWKAWLGSLMIRILYDDAMVLDSQLEAAWREIGKAVKL